MSQKVTIAFQANFIATVVVENPEDKDEILAAACDIDIPEGGTNLAQYVEGTFDVLSARDEAGKIIYKGS